MSIIWKIVGCIAVVGIGLVLVSTYDPKKLEKEKEDLLEKTGEKLKSINEKSQKDRRQHIEQILMEWHKFRNYCESTLEVVLTECKEMQPSANALLKDIDSQIANLESISSNILLKKS